MSSALSGSMRLEDLFHQAAVRSITHVVGATRRKLIAEAAARAAPATRTGHQPEDTVSDVVILRRLEGRGGRFFL
jgi:hypothetical protein